MQFDCVSYRSNYIQTIFIGELKKHNIIEFLLMIVSLLPRKLVIHILDFKGFVNIIELCLQIAQIG